MATKTRQELKDYTNANINTNGSQSITGSKMNTGLIDMIDSMAMGTQVSPEYVVVNELTGNTITPELDWNGKFFRWTNNANGILTLPQTSTLDLPQGWRFTIYNDTDNYSIQIVTEGTDTIRSHNNFYYIPATSDAQLGKLDAGTPNKYYADIEQSVMDGLGFIYNSASSIGTIVLADTWTEVIFPNPVTNDLLHVTTGSTAGSLKLNFPNHGTHACYATINVHCSIETANADQVIDLTFGINHAVTPDADAISQRVINGAAQTVGMFWPLALSYEGFVNNGDELSLFIRSSDAVQVNISKANFGITTGALIGVDVGI